MSTVPKKRALNQHPKGLTQKGMARFEVLGLSTDREMIRALAKRLASDDAESVQIRANIHQSMISETDEIGGILEALRRSPLVGADLNLCRRKTPSRDVDL